MAELFKPEVRDIGGTNVTAYTPPSMDYGTTIANIGQIFRSATEEKEVKGPTEAERKMEALRNVSSQMMKIDQIEDPTRKAVAFKSLQQNAYREYPVYVDDLNKFFGEVSGEIYPATGLSMEEINRDNRLKWAQESPEGKLAISQAMVQAPGDVEAQQLMIDAAYFKQQTDDAQAAEIKKRVGDKKDLFELESRPLIQGYADEKYNQIFNKANIETVLKSSETPSLALIDAVKAEKTIVLAEINRRINKYGLDPSTVKPENFVTQFDALIGMLEANSTIVDREFKNRAKVEWAERFSNASFIAKQYAAGNVDPTFWNWYMVVGGGEKEILSLMENKVGVGAQNGLSPTSMGPASPNTGPTDSASEVASRYESVFNREALINTFNNKTAWKPAIETGLKTVTAYKLEGESPEFMEASHNAISTMFMVSMPEFDTALQSMKPTNIKKLLGDKTFLIADSLTKKMPDKGMSLYNAMNEYSKRSAQVLVASFKTQMDYIKETENAPFIIEADEFGNLELVVNPVAARLDPSLKKAMGAYRFATRSKGARATETLAVEQVPTETDPKKILSNYIGLIGGENERVILDAVESLNVLARTSKKIPDSIKRGQDALTIIQQGLQ